MADKNILIFSVDYANRVVDCARWEVDPGFTNMDDLLSAYLSKQVQIAFKGTFIPDERIYCIEYPERLPRCNSLQDALQWKQNPRLEEKARCYSLQEVTFFFDEVKDSEDYIDTEQLNTMLYLVGDSPIEKARLENFVRLQNEHESNDQNRPLTAIASGEKMLLFDDSGRGVQAAQCYMQYIADHYFDRKNEQLNGLELYYFRTSDKSMIDLARNCYAWFDPSVMNAEHKLPLFRPERAVYHDRQLLKGLMPEIECDTEVHWQDYQAFMKKFQLKPLDRNENIAKLLMISEKGMPDINKPLFDGSFRHRKEFLGIMNRIKERQSFPSTIAILHQQAREIAQQILVTQYNLREWSHPKHKPEYPANEQSRIKI